LGLVATTARLIEPLADAAAVELVEAWPGPAVLAAADGRVLHANAAAQPMADLIVRADPRRNPLRVLDRSFEVAWLAWPGNGLRLAVARDVTAERNLTAALVQSRQLFKDLVACSTDFAWETDAEGRFSFVSAKGALGYSARELHGRPARELLAKPPQEGAPPFTTRVALDEIEVWLRRNDGELACVTVSCLPLFDRENTYLGVRGVAHDVTEARRLDAALAIARAREALVDRILDTARTEAEPGRLVAVAAEITAKALSAGDARVLRHDEDGHWLTVAQWRDGSLAEHATAPDATPDDTLLVAETRHRGRVNGMLRVAAERPFDAESRALFDGVAAQLGLAVEQLALYAALDRLSRVDHLTGLLNRRAFLDALATRLGHLRRYQRRGALLFVDMDNFKALNDGRGHAAGDAALVALAKLLGQGGRRGDVAGRLGGDEFALWLEETDAAGAATKADGLIAAVTREFGPLSADAERPLGLSIGIALWPLAVGGNDSPAALVARADAAMYAAKHSGKNRWSMAGAG